MEKTNEQKVKAAYPMAACFSNYNQNFDGLFRYWIVDGSKRLSAKCFTSVLAWQSAANSLDKDIEDGK